MIDDAIRFLNDNGPAVAAAATVALVVITGYYAWQNRRMAQEMRRTRTAQVLPSLKASIEMLAPGVGMWRITNVGPGAAVDVDLVMALVPRSDAPSWKRAYKAPLMVSGEHQDFLPAPDEQSGSTPHVETLGEAYEAFRVRGVCRDVLGQVHNVDHSIDISEWWALVAAARRRRVGDHAEATAKYLERIAKVLEVESRDRRQERSRGSMSLGERWEMGLTWPQKALRAIRRWLEGRLAGRGG